MPDEVKKIRQEIDYNFDTFKKIITNKKFVNTFNTLDFSKEFTLQRPPKGYEENNIAIDFIKLKTWIVGCKIYDKDLSDKNLAKKITTHFEIMKPFIDFLNEAI